MKTTNRNEERETNIAKRLAVWVGVIAVVLTVPLLANFPWTGFDLVVMGGLLFSGALAYELLAQQTGNRAIVGLIAAAIVFLIWAELSVGIIGTPFAGS